MNIENRTSNIERRKGFALLEILIVVAIIGILAAMILVPGRARAQGLVTPPYSTFAPNYWKQMTNVEVTVGTNTLYVIPGWQTNAYDVVRQANGESFIATVVGTNYVGTNSITSWTNVPPAFLNNVKNVAIRGILSTVSSTTNLETFLADVTADGTNWTSNDPIQWTVPLPMTTAADTNTITISLFEVSRSIETGSTY